jgi:hypothetical protein
MLPCHDGTKRDAADILKAEGAARVLGSTYDTCVDLRLLLVIGRLLTAKARPAADLQTGRIVPLSLNQHRAAQDEWNECRLRQETSLEVGWSYA